MTQILSIRRRAAAIVAAGILLGISLPAVRGADDAASKPVSVQIQLDYSEVPELEAWALKARQECETWYPRICVLLPWNSNPPSTHINLKFSKDMEGVAGTSSDSIEVAAKYVKKATNDFGMVIHEMTHVIQAYPEPASGCRKPGWLVEGIADYIRLFHYEPSAPRPRINPDKASYRDAYKTTAIFLDWVQNSYAKDLVEKLNRSLHDGRFQVGMFKDLTGKTVDELWKEYTDTLRNKS